MYDRNQAAVTEASPGGSAATTASLRTQNAADPMAPEVENRTGSGTEVRNASISLGVGDWEERARC